MCNEKPKVSKFILIVFVLLFSFVQAKELDPLLKNRLETWQDLKFGLFVHWGIYSQWGCVESWPLVASMPRSRPDTLKAWTDRDKDLDRFRRDYWDLYKTFNPTKFDPNIWAEAAKYAGMRYVMFTTRHHDGFSMFDTGTSDYKITSSKCPFSKDPRADITRLVFNAFANKGFSIGAYYSTADWHHPGYWDPNLPIETQKCNYDTLKNPKAWAGYVKHVHGQIEELTTKYGRIDILWLDSSWQWPPKEDIKMWEIAKRVRGNQPGCLVVKRAGNKNICDYITPEQHVPEKPEERPWETCMTMARQWSYKSDDTYKPTRQLIHTLVDIVSKGGNYLLNVGPGPDGKFPEPALAKLKEIGDWMKVNSEAIYASRAVAPYKEGRICLTTKNGSVYLIYLDSEKEPNPPAKIKISCFGPSEGSRIKMLGAEHRLPESGLRWEEDCGGVVVEIPKSLQQDPPCKYAWTLKIEKPKKKPEPLIYKDKEDVK
ncbi:MAG: alpha-L-fucosidase [Planctomycetota bacterium]|jgi:alpha-L-fucosidase